MCTTVVPTMSDSLIAMCTQCVFRNSSTSSSTGSSSTSTSSTSTTSTTTSSTTMSMSLTSLLY